MSSTISAGTSWAWPEESECHEVRVGVYFPGFPPEMGGGHVFEYEILLSLAAHASESRHEFVLLVQNRASLAGAELSETDNLKLVFFNEPPPVPSLDFWGRMRRRYHKVLRALGLMEKPKDPPGVEELFRLAVRDAQVELIWNPSIGSIASEVPYIATMWDIQHRLQPWWPEVSSDGEWARREDYFSRHLRRAAFIITGNETGMRELSFFYQIPEQRFRLLPHPAPRTVSRSSEEIASTLDRYSLAPGYLFYPAQFWAHKNHANLLAALQILRDEYEQKLNLVLVGSDQGNLSYIRNLADRLALQDQLHILGFVPREDLMALYQGAFALTFVTFFGPENLPPLEAFSLGCPVIASAVDGAAQQLGKAALLVEPTDPHQIAESIHRLSTDSALRNRLVASGFERAAQWTGADFIKGVLGILDEFEAVRRCWPSGEPEGMSSANP